MAETPRIMRLPKNSAYPNFNETHTENDWCAKAGCTPVCGHDAKEEKMRHQVECSCDPEYAHHCPKCNGAGYIEVETAPAQATREQLVEKQLIEAEHEIDFADQQNGALMAALKDALPFVPVHPVVDWVHDPTVCLQCRIERLLGGK